MNRWLSTCGPWLLATLSCLAVARAQCTPSWRAAGTAPGTDVGVYATTLWDPDGSGPQVPRLAIAGSFAQVVDTNARTLAVQDPTNGTWAAIPGLAGNDGLALASLPNGDLVVGGSIPTAGGVPCSNLARWDGTAWHTFGWGVNHLVYALAPLPNGELVVGGLFTAAAGLPVANYIARWDGSTFQPLGSGMNGVVFAIVVLPNGDLIAGGAFTQAGGVPVQGVARWNGTAWSSLGGFGMGTVHALHVRPNGDLIVAGSDLLRWDGSQWHPLGFAADGWCYSAATLANGELVVAGGFTTVNAQAMNRVARHDGSTWYPLGTGLSSGSSPIAWTTTVLPNGDLVVGGRITVAGGRTVQHLARWDGAWHGFGTGVDAEVLAVAALPNGDFVATGYFMHAGEQLLSRVGRWDGTSWQPLGAGLPAGAKALLAMPDGSVITSGSPFGGYMARWNGTTWSPMAQGIPGDVRCLALAANGDVIAGGSFNWAGNGPALRVARWDGTQWQPMGAGFDNTVVALATGTDGSLYAGGSFGQSGTTATPRVARWDGTQWQPIGNPQTNVTALAVLANGALVVAGDLASGPSRTVQQWTGSAWTSLGPGAGGNVLALAALPGGGLLAGGNFNAIGGFAANAIGYWNGSAWSTLGSGVNGTVRSLAVLPNGEVAVGGAIYSTVAAPASHVVVLQRPCAGSATVVPTACIGPAGAMALRPDTVPTPGATYLATARGFAVTAIAIHVVGFAPTSIPLLSLDPRGLPGCDLLVDPDVPQAALPSGDRSTQSIVVPGGTMFLGTQLHQQCVQMAEVNGAWSLSSSNALLVTIGL